MNTEVSRKVVNIFRSSTHDKRDFCDHRGPYQLEEDMQMVLLSIWHGGPAGKRREREKSGVIDTIAGTVLGRLVEACIG